MLTLVILMAKEFQTQSLAQESNIEQQISKPIENDRYINVEGDPYLYSDWKSAEVLTTDGETVTVEKVNFNGNSHQLDIKVGEEIRELNSLNYLRVIVDNDGNSDLFLRGIHSDFGLELICIPYDGNNVRLLKNFLAKEQEHSLPNSILKVFSIRVEYYIMINGRLTDVALKKKKILGALDHTSLLEDYIEAKGYKLKTETEVIDLLRYYDTELVN